MGEGEVTAVDPALELSVGFDDTNCEAILAFYSAMKWWGAAPMHDVRPLFVRALSNSYKVVTARRAGVIVGAGRMISDGIRYASIFDVAVLPEHQKTGVGRAIMEKLIEDETHQMIHLTSTFGNELFYEKLGFKKHRTAYARYPYQSPYLIG